MYMKQKMKTEKDDDKWDPAISFPPKVFTFEGLSCLNEGSAQEKQKNYYPLLTCVAFSNY